MTTKEVKSPLSLAGNNKTGLRQTHIEINMEDKSIRHTSKTLSYYHRGDNKKEVVTN